MKKIILLLFFFCTSALLVRAQENTKHTYKTSPAKTFVLDGTIDIDSGTITLFTSQPILTGQLLYTMGNLLLAES